MSVVIKLPKFIPSSDDNAPEYEKVFCLVIYFMGHGELFVPDSVIEFHRTLQHVYSFDSKILPIQANGFSRRAVMKELLEFLDKNDSSRNLLLIYLGSAKMTITSGPGNRDMQNGIPVEAILGFLTDSAADILVIADYGLAQHEPDYKTWKPNTASTAGNHVTVIMSKHVEGPVANMNTLSFTAALAKVLNWADGEKIAPPELRLWALHVMNPDVYQLSDGEVDFDVDPEDWLIVLKWLKSRKDSKDIVLYRKKF